MDRTHTTKRQGCFEFAKTLSPLFNLSSENVILKIKRDKIKETQRKTV